MKKQGTKIVVVGAGQVGATTAYTLLLSGLASELVLIDLNEKKARGEVLDLAHGIPLCPPAEIKVGTYADCENADIVILTAGANQKPGETRMDLTRKNIAVFRSIVPQVVKYASHAILLVVTNPCDVLTYVTWKISGLPSSQVIGSGTVLDTARLKYLLGERLGVDSRSVHAFIIGEHGDSELAVWSGANVSGVDLDQFCHLRGDPLDHEEMERIYQGVRDSAYEIIRRKGATYYGVAMAVERIVRAIVRDEHSVLPVSNLLQGQYGIDGLCMSIPAVVGRNGVEDTLEIPLSPAEREALRDSAATLRGVVDSLEL